MGFSRKESQPRDFKFQSQPPQLPAALPADLKGWVEQLADTFRGDHQAIEDEFAKLRASLSGLDTSAAIAAILARLDALEGRKATNVTNVTETTLVTAEPELTPDQKGALKGTNGHPSDGNRYVTQSDPRFGAMIQTGAPVGAMVDFPGATAPNGWFMCDGAEVSRVAYAALFAVIGTVYGVGDGSTTFNLPDCRGRSSMGAGTGTGLTARTLGQMLGEENHLLTAAESGLPQHSHVIPNLNPDSLANGPDGGFKSTSGGISTSDAGPLDASQAHNTIHPVIVLNRIIKF